MFRTGCSMRPAGEDMLGFSDTIFPAFLFIMGASVPLAVGSRRAQKPTTVKIVWHVFTRTFALVVMGLLTVNFGDAFSAAGTGLSRGNYAMLMVLGFFLVWNVYPRTESVWKKRGILLLQFLGSGAADLAGGYLPGQRRFGVRHSVVGHFGTDRMDLSFLYTGISGGRQTSGGACRCHSPACGGSLVAGVGTGSREHPAQPVDDLRFRQYGRLAFVACRTLCRCPGSGAFLSDRPVRRCGHARCGPCRPPLLDRLQTRRHADLVFLLLRDLLSALRPALLSDRCAGTCPLVRVG